MLDLFEFWGIFFITKMKVDWNFPKRNLDKYEKNNNKTKPYSTSKIFHETVHISFFIYVNIIKSLFLVLFLTVQQRYVRTLTLISFLFHHIIIIIIIINIIIIEFNLIWFFFMLLFNLFIRHTKHNYSNSYTLIISYII